MKRFVYSVVLFFCIIFIFSSTILASASLIEPTTLEREAFFESSYEAWNAHIKILVLEKDSFGRKVHCPFEVLRASLSVNYKAWSEKLDWLNNFSKDVHKDQFTKIIHTFMFNPQVANPSIRKSYWIQQCRILFKNTGDEIL